MVVVAAFDVCGSDEVVETPEVVDDVSEEEEEETPGCSVDEGGWVL